MYAAVVKPAILGLVPALFLLGANGASAAPDPMTAGTSLERVEVHAMSGAVRVKLQDTQHVRLNGKERDAKRAGKSLVIKRMLGDVELTLPPHVVLVVQAASGAVRVEGAVKDATLKVASGDVEVRGSVERLKLDVSSGNASLEVALAPAATVDATVQSGNIRLAVVGDTPFALDARTVQGAISGRELATADAKAKVKLRATSGSIAVSRAK